MGGICEEEMFLQLWGLSRATKRWREERMGVGEGGQKEKRSIEGTNTHLKVSKTVSCSN